MHTVTSFDGDSIEPGQLSGVMADYFALERARIYRRLCVRRFAILALILGAIGFGLRWLPPFASWLSVSLCTIPPAGAWMSELRCDWKLTKRLNDVTGVTHVTLSDSGVRKS
jgi:hypothetical protein